MAKGEITHIEIPADDADRARRFYAAVAGWEFNEMPGYADYWLFRTGETTGGGLGVRNVSVADKIRIYITVDSLEAGIAAATANGGTVKEPPAEVPGQGRYAVLLDPEGSEIALWESLPA